MPLLLGLSYYLAATAAADTFLNTDFIASSFQRSQLYDRIYQEVLLRQEFSSWTNGLIGGLEVSDDDKAQLLMKVAPPAYIEEETERNVSELLEFFRGADNELDVFIDLNTPLENSKSTILAFLDQRIDALDSVTASSSPELSNEIASFLTTINDGEIPSHVPSGEALDPDQQLRAYQQAVDALSQSNSLAPAALTNLRQQEPEIRSAIRKGDLRESLELAGHAVAEARIDEALTVLRGKTGEQEHLDLVEQLANNIDRTPTQVLRDARILRLALQATTSVIARWTALAIAILCVVGIALLFVPYWKHVLFWPSLALFVCGLLLLIAAFSTALDTLYWSSMVCPRTDLTSCQLTLDVARNIAAGIGAWFAEGALKIIIIGSIGIIVTFIVSGILRRKSL
jgi:hypothetical protein